MFISKPPQTPCKVQNTGLTNFQRSRASQEGQGLWTPVPAWSVTLAKSQTFALGLSFPIHNERVGLGERKGRGERKRGSEVEEKERTRKQTGEGYKEGKATTAAKALIGNLLFWVLSELIYCSQKYS